jgi:hypothetical protein
MTLHFLPHSGKTPLKGNHVVIPMVLKVPTCSSTSCMEPKKNPAGFPTPVQGTHWEPRFFQSLTAGFQKTPGIKGGGNNFHGPQHPVSSSSIQPLSSCTNVAVVLPHHGSRPVRAAYGSTHLAIRVRLRHSQERLETPGIVRGHQEPLGGGPGPQDHLFPGAPLRPAYRRLQATESCPGAVGHRWCIETVPGRPWGHAENNRGRLATAGCCWVLLATRDMRSGIRDHRWPPLAAAGCRWELLAAAGCVETSLDAAEHRWVLLTTAGRPWPLLPAAGYRWPPTQVCGLPAK